ncbi:MAG: hypothetical protein HZB56_07035 [Deltaproteobacteria bacterium]|nr:hypothetical protein [Deltaproteobacteria bacterium]
MAAAPEAQVLLLALEELRRAFGDRAAPGTDPRSDTGPFRAFRAALLEAAAGCARGEARLSVWWEGTFNGYALALEVVPGAALPGLAPALAAVCPVEAVRTALPRPDALPLALVGPGAARLLADEAGARVELPFGAPTGHFGAPGVLRVKA